MGKMKFMFPNAQGIWLHDTPEKEKIDEAARLASNGCVRLADAARFGQWLFGYRLKPQDANPTGGARSPNRFRSTSPISPQYPAARQSPIWTICTAATPSSRCRGVV